MKKLNESERLERGVQILLSAQDKADLEKMARANGRSLSGAARPLVIRALDKWRKDNPELAAMELPAKAKTLVLDGKAVRTQRSMEAQIRIATNGLAKANGVAATQGVPAANGTAPLNGRPAAKNKTKGKKPKKSAAK